MAEQSRPCGKFETLFCQPLFCQTFHRSCHSLTSLQYCTSRFQAASPVMIGSVGIGGSNPIRPMMTTTNTQDVDATVAQTLALADAGCEIVRNAPQKAAEALAEIYWVVQPNARCHWSPTFTSPAAARKPRSMSRKSASTRASTPTRKFAVTEYSDAAYNEEPSACTRPSPNCPARKEPDAMRIGTNHGSLLTVP